MELISLMELNEAKSSSNKENRNNNNNNQGQASNGEPPSGSNQWIPKIRAPSDMAKGQPWQKREGMPNWQPPGDIPNGQLPSGQSVNLKIIL